VYVPNFLMPPSSGSFSITMKPKTKRRLQDAIFCVVITCSDGVSQSRRPWLQSSSQRNLKSLYTGFIQLPCLCFIFYKKRP